MPSLQTWIVRVTGPMPASWCNSWLDTLSCQLYPIIQHRDLLKKAMVCKTLSGFTIMTVQFLVGHQHLGT